MKKLTKEDLASYVKSGHLTVGDIKEWFAMHPNLPDDAPILVERIEDMYFDKIGWGVYLKEGEVAWNIRNMNRNMKEEISIRERGEEWEYPHVEDPSKFIVEITDEHMTQYHPLWSCVRYNDEDGIMFIDAHY